MGCQTG